MKIVRWVWVGCVLMASAAGVASISAEEPSAHQAASRCVMLEKLGRGLGNIVSGWLEIPLMIQQHYDPKDPASSFFAGTFTGLVKGTVRTVVGVYETATFLIPIPPGYTPVLPPVGYFEEASRWHKPGSI